MKKIMLGILIIVCFLSTGCYDYIELSDRAIISSISIDYKNNEYEVVFEILNPNSETGSSDKEKVFYAKGIASNMTEAFNNASLNIDKKPYFAHLKVLVLSEEIGENHIAIIRDYFLRATIFPNNFYVVLAKDKTAKEILKFSIESEPIVGETLINLIDNNQYFQTVAQKVKLEDFIVSTLNKRKTAYLPVITVENEKLAITGIGIFNEGKLKTLFKEQEASVLTLLQNENKNYIMTNQCNLDETLVTIKEKEETSIKKETKKKETVNKYTGFNIMKSKTKINVMEKNKVTININLNANLVQNDCNYDLHKMDAYEYLENILKQQLQQELEAFFKLCQENDVDLIGLQKLYYNKYRIYPSDWKQIEIEYDITVTLSKTGITYEVEE